MKVLVLNSGSSSLKYQVIDMKTEETLAKGYFESRKLSPGGKTKTAFQL